MTNKTDFRSSQELLAEERSTPPNTTKSESHAGSFHKLLPALLFALICTAWIGLDNSTGRMFQAQIVPACFIISCLLFFRASAQ